MVVVPFALSLTSLKVVAGLIMEEAIMSSENVAVTSAVAIAGVLLAGLVLITVGGPGTGSVGVVPSGTQLSLPLRRGGVVPSSATNLDTGIQL